MTGDRDGKQVLVNAIMNNRVPRSVGKYLDYLRTCELFRKESSPWS